MSGPLRLLALLAALLFAVLATLALAAGPPPLHHDRNSPVPERKE